VPGNNDVAEFMTEGEALPTASHLILAQENLGAPGTQSDRDRVTVMRPGDVFNVAEGGC
jgi:hypothetical protein